MMPLLLALTLVSITPQELGQLNTQRCTTYVSGDLPPTKPRYEVACNPERPEECAFPIDVGEPAPFAGVLVSPALGARLATENKRLREELALEQGKAEKESAAMRLSYDKLRIKDQEQMDALIEEQQPAFYERPIFVIPVTVVVTLGLVFGAAKLFEATK